MRRSYERPWRPDTCQRPVSPGLTENWTETGNDPFAATIKDAKLKKVQAAIQGEQVRVSSPSKDDLQAAITLLRAGEFGVELKFGNFR